MPQGHTADVRRGMELLERLPEVRAEEVTGDLAKLYDDIRNTLRVPFVNFIFRALANYPTELEALWYGFKPAFRRMAMERVADDLRRHAFFDDITPSDTDLSEKLDAEDRIRAYTDSIHYVLPKLLLVVSAFTSEREPAPAGDEDSDAPPSASQQLPYGPAPGTLRLPMVEPADASPEVAELFDDIRRRHGHPGVASYFRVLANWPPFLDEVSEQLRPRIGGENYETRKESLIAKADRAVRRHLVGALSDADEIPAPSDDVNAILAVFRQRLVPDLLLDVSIIEALLRNGSAPRRSPFGPTISDDESSDPVS